MAEGGTEEFDLDGLSIPSNEPLPDEGQETSFIDDDGSTQYRDNVVDTSTFEPPRAIHPELQKKEFRYTENISKLIPAMKTTEWKYTKEGLRRLVPRIKTEGSHIYYEAKLSDKQIKKIEDKDKDLIYEEKDENNKTKHYLRLTTLAGRFFSEKTMQSKYGVHITRKVADTLFSDEEKAKAEAEVEAKRKAEAEAKRKAEAEASEPSRTQPQQISPETQHIVDTLETLDIDPIKQLIDVDEEELKRLGFSDNALRELRGLIKASEEFAVVKRDKDMQIQELEKQNQELGKKVNDLVTEYINTTALDVADKDELEKEIGVLKKEKEEVVKKLVIERKKVFELRTEEESQIRRMKSLITDVLKNPESEIPLKDRIKLLFKIEGLTVAAIIASITMFFTTLGLSISNSLRGSTPSPKPPSPSPEPPSPEPPTPSPEPEPDILNKVKAGLKKFAEWLKELAKKSLSALPGIIGSIVSFIFKSAGAVVGFLAEHLIILGFIIVSSIV